VGAEAKCRLTVGRKTADGKALLETDELIFRGGDVRLSIPYKSISAVDAKDGALRVTSREGVAVFELGDSASTWADRIRNPPSRIDKLGVKSGQRVLLVGVRDAALRGELVDRGAEVSPRLSGEADVIFFAAGERAELRRLGPLQKNLKRDGAIWVIRPKGSDAISEGDVMKAGRAAGLVDVKVVRFSNTHTAEKFVIPVARR
jgi:hypothetical protein